MARWFVMVGIVVGVLLGASRARATCCQTAADCPRGFGCVNGSCDATIVDCACDTDCGPNLYCIPAVATVCTQAAGSATQDCHPKGQCSTAWKRPCATTADCGEGGFTCTLTAGFVCQGSDCQTISTCTAPALPSTCATDADCPSAWTCEPDTQAVTACIYEGPRSCPNGGCPPPQYTGAKSCMPPLYDLVGPAGFSGAPVVLPASCPAKADAGGGAGAQGAAGGSSGASGAAGQPGTAMVGLARTAGGGCQLSPIGSESWGSLFGAFGLLLGVRLRSRARRAVRPPR